MGSHGWLRTCAFERWIVAKGRVNTWRPQGCQTSEGIRRKKNLTCNRKGGALLVMKINAMRTGRSANPVEITLERVRGVPVRPVPTRDRQRKLRNGPPRGVAMLRLCAQSIVRAICIVFSSTRAFLRSCIARMLRVLHVPVRDTGSSLHAQSGIAHLTSHPCGAKCRPRTPTEPPRQERDADPRRYPMALPA